MKRIFYTFGFTLLSSTLISQSIDLIGKAGGTGQDEGRSIAVDGAGNIYVAGSFQGTDVTTLLGSAGANDVFLTKYDANGQVLWARRAGGTSNDKALGIAINGTDVYITGEFVNTANFNTPSSPGSNEIISAGASDIFIAKYNSDGTFQWAKRAGSTLADYGWGIAANSTDVYITGVFSDVTDFNTPSASGSNEIISEGNTDIFLAKFNSNGIFQWAKRAGGTGFDTGVGVALIGSSVYISGDFNLNANFNTPSTTGSNEIESAGAGDAFLAKFDENGNFDWAKRAGGTSNDGCRAIAVNTNTNEIYITGAVGSSANFNTPSSTTSNVLSTSGNDFYLAKFNNLGDFQWARRGAGSAWGIAVADDLIYVTGAFSGDVNFTNPYSFGNPNQLSSVGGTDIFLVNYNSQGNYNWSARAGGSGSDFGIGLCANGASIYTTGYFFTTTDFNTPSLSGSNELVSEGGQDIFFARYIDHNCSSLQVTANLSGNTLTSSITNAVSYQWLDCNNSNAAISGASNMVFTPSISGNYAVQISSSVCTAVSPCVNVTISNPSSILENENETIIIFPNPSNTVATVSGLRSGQSIKIIDVSGKIISQKIVTTNRINLSVAEMPNGIYFIQIEENDTLQTTKKLVVNK